MGWCAGYAALTYAWRDKDRIVGYINRQQEHHRRISFEEEVRRFLREPGVVVDETEG